MKGELGGSILGSQRILDARQIALHSSYNGFFSHAPTARLPPPRGRRQQTTRYKMEVRKVYVYAAEYEFGMGTFERLFPHRRGRPNDYDDERGLRTLPR